MHVHDCMFYTYVMREKILSLSNHFQIYVVSNMAFR
jgi:hypothetical protein